MSVREVIGMGRKGDKAHRLDSCQQNAWRSRATESLATNRECVDSVKWVWAPVGKHTVECIIVYCNISTWTFLLLCVQRYSPCPSNYLCSDQAPWRTHTYTPPQKKKTRPGPITKSSHGYYTPELWYFSRCRLVALLDGAGFLQTLLKCQEWCQHMGRLPLFPSAKEATSALNLQHLWLAVCFKLIHIELAYTK